MVELVFGGGKLRVEGVVCREGKIKGKEEWEKEEK